MSERMSVRKMFVSKGRRQATRCQIDTIQMLTEKLS